MKKFFQLAVVAVMLLAATTTASAQKFAYVNSAQILAELPAMKAAESNLEGLQKQLQKKGKTMVEAFQADVAAVQQKAQAGELTPKMQEAESTRLEKKQQEIANFEQKMVADLQAKRAALLEPIYEKVNTAIKAVAEAEGYTFVFDQQVLLYGQDSADISAAVKAKL